MTDSPNPTPGQPPVPGPAPDERPTVEPTVPTPSSAIPDSLTSEPLFAPATPATPTTPAIPDASPPTEPLPPPIWTAPATTSVAPAEIGAPALASADAGHSIWSDPATTYSPAPEPTSDWERTARSGASAGTGAGPTPGTWFEQAPTSAPAAVPARERRAGPGLAAIAAVAIGAAVVASGGTFIAIDASGALDRSVASAPAGQGTTTSSVPTTQSGRFDESSAIIDAAAKAGPAVVQITSTAGVNPNNLGSLPQQGIGSGVIFDSNGWILTNHHVVAGSDQLVVALQNGKTYPGTIYGVDTLTDLAIVKIAAKGLPVATMGDSDSLKVGQLAVAIGSPLGTYTNTVTSGIVSALGRSIAVDSGTTLNNLIQTDTAINPGNSGGPLLDAGGNVIGIDTAVASNAQGIGFAIPIDIAKPLLQQALAGETLVRPWIGIRYQPIDQALVQADKLPIDHGALVGAGQDTQGNTTPAVVAGSPADKAGIKDRDIVTSIEGTPIDTQHPLDAVIAQFAPGRTVTVEVYRNGGTVKLQVTLGTRPAGL
jgi:S1-C subfamily serine protease